MNCKIIVKGLPCLSNQEFYTRKSFTVEGTYQIVEINPAGMHCGNMSLKGISYVSKENMPAMLNTIVANCRQQNIGVLFHTMGGGYSRTYWESLGFEEVANYWNPYDSHTQYLLILNIKKYVDLAIPEVVTPSVEPKVTL